MRVALLFFLYALSAFAVADESVRICYGYGCLVETDVVITEQRLHTVAFMLNVAVNAENEREILSSVMGRLYGWAGEQSPIHNDRGGNYADEGVSGAMDCIDHSTTSTRFLDLLERRGMLRWHRVLSADVRRTFYVFLHYSAVIEEKSVVPDSEPRRFAVDSWFVDNGKPAVILPLEEWKNGAGPDV